VGKSPWLARAGRFFDPERHDPASFEEQAAELQMPTPLGEAEGFALIEKPYRRDVLAASL
jgi:hypothetical protein